MPLLSRHPAAVAVVAAALAATAVVFGFFGPGYHPKGESGGVKVDWTRYPPASEGWTWAAGQPGFRFGEHEEEWNFSGVRAAELAPARAAARRSGVAPASVRLLGAIRLGRNDLNMIVAGTDAADETCIGFVTPNQPVKYLCPPRLDAASGFVFAVSRTWTIDGVARHPAWLVGIARSDVDRLAVDQPSDWNDETVLDSADHSYWGTWVLSLADSRRPATVTAYREDGDITSTAIAVGTQGGRITEIPG